MSDALEVIAHPRRRRLLELLWAQERTVSDLHAHVPDITLGAVSQHLRRLRESGIVRVRADGRRRRYSVVRDALGPLAPALDAMWGAKLDALAHLAEAEEARLRIDPRRASTPPAASGPAPSTKEASP